MAALDDILTTSSPQGMKPKPIQVAPPPVDPSMQGAGSTVGSKPVEPRVTVTKPQSPAPSSASSMVSTDVKPRLSYVQMYEAFNPNKPETDEERAKREKQEKREAIFSALGDGISALSNLFFTSRYAPNAYDPSKGMSAKAKERWDKLRQEREANRKAYQEGYMRAAAMDDANARDDRNWQHTLEREKIADHYKESADARAQAKADRDAAMAQLRLDLMQGKIDQQEAAVRIKEIELLYAEEYWQSRIAKNNYRPIGSGGGRPGEYPWYDSNGNVHYAHSYEAMKQNAQMHGTLNEQTQQSTSTSTVATGSGNTKSTTTTTTTKPAKGHSSKPIKPNPMGSNNQNSKTGKKQNPMS